MSYTKTLMNTNYLNLSVVFPHWLRRRFRILDLFFYTIWAGLCVCLFTVTLPADAAVKTKKVWHKPRIRVIKPKALVILAFVSVSISCSRYCNYTIKDHKLIPVDNCRCDTIHAKNKSFN